MKLKFNLGKPGLEHLYFCVEQEKHEPFIYSINGKMLNCNDSDRFNRLIENGNYISVIQFLQGFCTQNLHDGRIFRLCNFIKKNLLVDSIDEC